MHHNYLYRSVFSAIGAAILFGSSTPLAKNLIKEISPLILAGLFYLGSGLGLLVVRFIRDKSWSSPNLLKKEWLWLFLSTGVGGIVGPILLMIGLKQTDAATASLLLNFEAVLTTTIAWLFFKENTDYKIILGMVFIVAGGVILAWSEQAMSINNASSLIIIIACFCWAIDNNLMRKISHLDAFFTASIKGLLAGLITFILAFILKLEFPALSKINLAVLVGFLGYGLSLVLFILALRGIGTARTGAYFSTSPFIGAVIAIVFLKEIPTSAFWVAALLMGIGVWLHLIENHEHKHTHIAIFHEHVHTHDAHHQHEHDSGIDLNKPHTHAHQHIEITHSHLHYPDTHHIHEHKNK